MTPDQVYGTFESVAFWLFVLVIVATVFFSLLAEEPIIERIFAAPIVVALIGSVAYLIFYEPAAGIARIIFKEPFTETVYLFTPEERKLFEPDINHCPERPPNLPPYSLDFNEPDSKAEAMRRAAEIFEFKSEESVNKRREISHERDSCIEAEHERVENLKGYSQRHKRITVWNWDDSEAIRQRHLETLYISN